MMERERYAWEITYKSRSIIRNIYIKWLQRKVPLLEVVTI